MTRFLGPKSVELRIVVITFFVFICAGFGFSVYISHQQKMQINPVVPGTVQEVTRSNLMNTASVGGFISNTKEASSHDLSIAVRRSQPALPRIRGGADIQSDHRDPAPDLKSVLEHAEQQALALEAAQLSKRKSLEVHLDSKKLLLLRQPSDRKPPRDRAVAEELSDVLDAEVEALRLVDIVRDMKFKNNIVIENGA